jgi:GT2 family glycosyltransferase
MKRTGAVIVTYNSAAEIGSCVDAALARLDKIVVVDNDSRDGTRKEVLKRQAVQWISNSTNRGFAAAVNQGIQEVDSSFVLLLNPDAVLLTGVESLIEACGQPEVAAAAGKLVDDQYRPQVGFNVRRFPTLLSLSFEVLGLNRVWPGNPVNRRFRCLDFNHESSGDVEQPAGAFLMVRRDAWEALGGFDEGFHPLWFEDVDFLKRAVERGYRVVYVPRASAMHSGGHAARKISQESRAIYWYASLLRYIAKHFPPLERRAVCAAMVAGCALRMLVGVFLERNLDPFRVYSKVIWLACLQLLRGGVGGAKGSPVPARHQSGKIQVPGP